MPGTACGQPRNFRTLIVIRKGQASTAALLPGESNAGPDLEADARRTMRITVNAHLGTRPGTKDSDCPMDVLDTTLAGHVVPKPHTVWDEVWLVCACGHKMNVSVEFIPDDHGAGTTFDISPGKIVDVP